MQNSMNERFNIKSEKNPEEWELGAILQKGRKVLGSMKEDEQG